MAWKIPGDGWKEITDELIDELFLKFAGQLKIGKDLPFFSRELLDDRQFKTYYVSRACS